ncbi:hypothetical protein BH10PSE17_BH10PSE17_02230 [soil metagenome]
MAEELPPVPDAAALYESAACGLMVTSLRGTIIRVNSTLCDWLGYSAGDLLGKKKLQDLFTIGGRIFHQTHWVPMLSTQGSVSEVKLDLLRSDGRALPFMINGRRNFAATGAFDEVSLVIAEERNKYEQELLAARKRADELLVMERAAQSRLHQAMRSGALFVWDLDLSDMTRRFGDEVATLLGHHAAQPIDAQTFEAAIHPDDRDAERDALARALARDDDANSWNFRLIGVDGQTRFVACSGHAFVDAHGKLGQFVGVMSDVTQTERQREAAQDRALFAEQMVGIVSHDLKGPLSAILMGGKLLERSGILPAEKMRLLDNMTHAARRAQRLVEELLDFTLARLGPGLWATREPLSLHAQVARLVEELSLANPDHTIVHRAHGEGSCSADSDRLAQLIGNLVQNAVSYGEAGGQVTVTSAVLDGYVLLTVHNFGQPIAARSMTTLFEPMTSGDDHCAIQNVGLGLFIVRAIARAHGGDVSVTSEADAGTCFSVTFPADAAPAPAEPGIRQFVAQPCISSDAS